MFSGLHVHVFPTGMGKKRLTLFNTQIKEHGGQPVEKYNPSNELLTHVVVEDSLDVDKCFKLIRADQLGESVKIVRTLWLSKCLKETSLCDTDDYELKRKASTARYQYDRVAMKRGIANLKPVDFDGEKVSSAVEANRSDDSNYYSDSGSTKSSPIKGNYVVEKSLPKKLRRNDIEGKYVCSQSSHSGTVSHNEHIIQELQKLWEAYKNGGDQWRCFGYEKAISAIKRYNKPIESFEEAKAIRGVGEKMAMKVMEIIEVGQLRKVEEICSSEKAQVLDLFNKVWGAGPTTAEHWYQQGFRSLEDLSTKANLTKQQKIGLKHFDDIQDRMPRKEAEDIGSVVKAAAQSIDPGFKVVICGSCRRGKLTCGDIDVLITHPDGKSHETVLFQLHKQLKETGFLTDDLVYNQVNGAQKKYLGVCKLPGENRRHRRIDIITAPHPEYIPALMHFTGSGHFNRSMRLLASRKGMSLSEHALRGGIVRQGRDKLTEGYIIPTPTEESVFEELGLTYRPPEERDH